MFPVRHCLLIAVLLANPLTVAVPAAAAELVEVQLTSGRTFTALVDGRSDEEYLWLRFEHGSTTLWRPVDWDRVEAARQNDQSLTIEQLQAQAAVAREQAEAAAAETAAETTLPSSPDRAAGVDRQPEMRADHRITMAEQARYALNAVRPVRSIRFDTSLANWDADAENDGLLLYVSPVDSAGREVAVDGLVEVILSAPRAVDFDLNPHSRGLKVDRVARWSVPIEAWQIQHGQPLQLPFQAVDPEGDRAWGPIGRVFVRVSIPGHGVFESFRDGVRIREYQPIADLAR